MSDKWGGKRRLLLIPLVTAAAIVASNGIVIVLSTNEVGDSKLGNAYRWEPTAAVGARWAHGWFDYGYGTSAVSSWNGVWGSPVSLKAPNGMDLDDLNLGYDSTRSRFVFAALEFRQPTRPPQPNIWYGYSTDSTGTAWVVSSVVLHGSLTSAGWDYPSIGVDATGRIIIGGVSFVTSGCASTPCPNGYYSVVSTNGSTFSSPSIVTPGTSTGFGARSRVVAAGSLFHAFVPTLNANNQPTAVNRWQSSDGISWTGPNLVASFAAPSNNSPPGTTPIFYATLLAAQGYANGLWTVAFQINNGGFNNGELCTSSRGCGIVNSFGSDQFLVGTSVSGDSGFWVSYYTYTSAPRNLPLITQAIYYAPGKAGIGMTTNPGIVPTSWFKAPQSFDRCPSESCYGAGDFQTVASNPFANASTPFIEQSTTHPGYDDIFQNFVEDPQGSASNQNFVPNTIWLPLGEDVSYLAAGAGPEEPGLPPGLTRGAP